MRKVGKAGPFLNSLCLYFEAGALYVNLSWPGTCCIEQVGLELRSACLGLLGAKIPGVCQHPWVCVSSSTLGSLPSTDYRCVMPCPALYTNDMNLGDCVYMTSTWQPTPQSHFSLIFETRCHVAQAGGLKLTMQLRMTLNFWVWTLLHLSSEHWDYSPEQSFYLHFVRCWGCKRGLCARKAGRSD